VIVRFVLWNLADADATVAELREYIRDEAADAFTDLEGLLFKGWVSDETTDRWGAIYVFASREAAAQPLPSRARELIGKDPDIVEVFDLEASVSPTDELDRLGLAFE
jgi:putative monooxygenase ydhR